MKNERDHSTDIKSYSKAEKNKTGKLLDYLCNISYKLIIFLTYNIIYSIYNTLLKLNL